MRPLSPVCMGIIFAPAATGFEKAILPMRDIQRGDILVFKFPEEPDRDFIKRTIGCAELPGTFQRFHKAFSAPIRR